MDHINAFNPMEKKEKKRRGEKRKKEKELITKCLVCCITIKLTYADYI